MSEFEIRDCGVKIERERERFAWILRRVMNREMGYGGALYAPAKAAGVGCN